MRHPADKMDQLDLFAQPSLNVTRDIKDAMHRDAAESHLSREQIVDRMNSLAERYGVSLAHGNSKGLSLELLEKWLNPADTTRQMPLRALPVWCAAVGRCSVLEVLARPVGLRLIGPQEQKHLAWAEANLAVKRHRRKIREIEAQL